MPPGRHEPAADEITPGTLLAARQVSAARKSGAPAALHQGTRVVLPIGVLLSAAVGVVFYFRDGAMERIGSVEKRQDKVEEAGQSREYRIIRLERDAEHTERDLEEIKAGVRNMNHKLDQVLTRGGAR